MAPVTIARPWALVLAAGVVIAVLTVRAEAQRAPRSLRAAVVARLDERRSDLELCVLRPLPREQLRVRARIVVVVPEGEGAIEIEPAREDDAAARHVARCALGLLGGGAPLPAGRATITVSLRRPVRRTGERHDGTEGAICRWGEHRHAGGDEADIAAYPRAAACGPGLSCCGGGAAGSDASCMRVRRCPPLP